VPSLGWRIRAGALVALGALGVHDLRYLLEYRGHAAGELSLQGHGYLRFATPLIAGMAVLAAAAFAARLMRAYAEGDGAEGRALPSTRRIWALAGSLLIAVYACQEWTEGALAAGHPGGLTAPFSHGGWLALPLAVAIGLLIALALRGAAAAIAVAARGRARAPLGHGAALLSSVTHSVWAGPRESALARRLSPRAPPASAG
jgi:hypothetical protein